MLRRAHVEEAVWVTSGLSHCGTFCVFLLRLHRPYLRLWSLLLIYRLLLLLLLSGMP